VQRFTNKRSEIHKQRDKFHKQIEKSIKKCRNTFVIFLLHLYTSLFIEVCIGMYLNLCVCICNYWNQCVLYFPCGCSSTMGWRCVMQLSTAGHFLFWWSSGENSTCKNVISSSWFLFLLFGCRLKACFISTFWRKSCLWAQEGNRLDEKITQRKSSLFITRL